MGSYTKVVILPFHEYEQLMKAAGRKITSNTTGVDLRQLLNHTTAHSSPYIGNGSKTSTISHDKVNEEYNDEIFDTDDDDELTISKDSITRSSLASAWEPL